MVNVEFKTSLREILAPVRQDMEAKGLTEKDIGTEIKAHRAQKVGHDSFLTGFTG